MSLTESERLRYSQQLKLPEVGMAGQLKLKNARVLCVGAGGLGSSLLLYLAAAGIGTLGIVDDDVVELSNLQRQVLYQEAQLGHKKALAAKEQLAALNPAIHLEAYPERLHAQNAPSLLSQYDLIADCSDNFATRYLINDLAYALNKAHVFAAVSGFEGQCALFLAKKTPCLRCLFPEASTTKPLSSCEAAGILGLVPGILGLIQATEIIKQLLQLGEPLQENLLVVNLLKLSFRKLHFSKNKDCFLCKG